MTVAALMAFLPQEANAQFFKKLGKALEKVDKALDSVVGDTNAKETATAKQATLLQQFDTQPYEHGRGALPRTHNTDVSKRKHIIRHNRGKDFGQQGHLQNFRRQCCDNGAAG